MEDRLGNVEQSLARLEVKVELLLANQQVHHSVMQRALHGTGDSPGIVVRVDRIEEWRSRANKLTALMLAAVLPLVGQAAMGALRGL